MAVRREERIRCLGERRRKLAKGIRVPQGLLRGSLAERRIECANPGCGCHSRGGHGPYLYLSQTHEKQRHTCTLMPRELKKEIRTALANYRKLKRDLYRLSDINLELLKLGGLRPSGEKKRR